MAEKLQKKLAYTCIPQATGFVRVTLGAHRCDVIMGFPQGDDLVQSTNPYYRTAYALVTKPGTGLDDVDDAGRRAAEGQAYRHRRRHAARTYMVADGLMTDAKPYPLVIDTRSIPRPRP